jgi:hypothetical protein
MRRRGCSMSLRSAEEGSGVVLSRVILAVFAGLELLEVFALTEGAGSAVALAFAGLVTAGAVSGLTMSASPTRWSAAVCVAANVSACLLLTGLSFTCAGRDPVARALYRILGSLPVCVGLAAGWVGAAHRWLGGAPGPHPRPVIGGLPPQLL